MTAPRFATLLSSLGWDLTRRPGFLLAKAHAVLQSLGWESDSVRITRSLLASFLPNRDPLQDELPLLSYPTIAWLAEHLTLETVAFEWGSGGSTLFLARRVRQLTSVEHDPGWYRAVSSALARRGWENCALHLREPEPRAAAEVSPYGPDAAVSGMATYKGLSFTAYAQAIDAHPDGSLDLVLVDGRARAACLVRAVSKVRSGGHLLLDDAQRPRYTAAVRRLAHLPREDLVGPSPYDEKVRWTAVWTVSGSVGDR